MKVEDILTKSGKIATALLNHYKSEVEEILKEWPSIATWAYCQRHSIEPRRCHCGKLIPVQSFVVGYRDGNVFCSPKCIDQKFLLDKRNATNLKRYGTHSPSKCDEVKEKIRQTTFERYGVEHALQAKEIRERIKATNTERYGGIAPTCSDEVIAKRRKNNIEKYGCENPAWDDVQKEMVRRYGVDNISKSPEIKEKKRQTSIRKYGVDSPMKNEAVVRSLKERFLEKYGVEAPSQVEWIRDKQRASRRETTLAGLPTETRDILMSKDSLEVAYTESGGSVISLSASLGITPTLLRRIMDEYGIDRTRQSTSSLELRVRSLLDSVGIRYETNYRLPLGMEIDVFIPSINVGIECHGLYYHSHNIYATVQGPSDPKYHVKKHDEAVSNGIKLLQFFEDDIQNKWDIIASMILNACGLSTRHYARKTEVKILDTPTARAFCESNHKDGYSNAKLALGLFQDDILLSVMTFGKSRFEKREGMWEVIRFCTLRGHQVIGGGSKMVKAAKEFLKNEMTSLVTYADKMIGDGTSYEKMGFTPLDDVAAGYYWVFNGERRARQQFQKHKLHRILEDYDPNQTETVNMMRHGHRKLYNAGYRKFIKRWE